MSDWYDDCYLDILRDELRDLDFTRNSGNFVKAYVLGRIDIYLNEKNKRDSENDSSQIK